MHQVNNEVHPVAWEDGASFTVKKKKKKWAKKAKVSEERISTASLTLAPWALVLFTHIRTHMRANNFLHCKKEFMENQIQSLLLIHLFRGATSLTSIIIMT